MWEAKTRAAHGQPPPGSDQNAGPFGTNFIIEQDTSEASLHCLCLADLVRY